MTSSPETGPAQPILLDTCAAIWLMGGDPLSVTAQSALLNARSSGAGIYVSLFTAWEVGMLITKGRFRIAVSPEVWFETLTSLPGIRIAPLTAQILLNSNALPGVPPNDPADRIIAATGRAFGYPIVTRDRLLIDYADQGHINTIVC
jgi:PIN domain nuclease of toxin-antitoxin system